MDTTRQQQNDELLAYSLAKWAGTEYRTLADESLLTPEVVELAVEHLEILQDEVGRWLGTDDIEADDV